MRTRPARTLAALGSLSIALMTMAQLACAQAPAAKPVAVITFSGYDELMKDINFVGSLMNNPQMSQGLEMMLMSMTEQKGLAGLDKTKPIGVIINHDGTMPSGAAYLPVTDLKALLGVLGGLGIQSEDMGNGVMQIKGPGQSIFAKSAGNWAVLSITPQTPAGLPDDPTETFAPLVKEYDLAARVFVQNVPEATRQQLVELISQGARQGMSKKPDETDADYAERQKQMDAQLDEMKRGINELDQFTFGLGLDNAGNRAVLDFMSTAVAGTKSAEQYAEAAKTTTNYAGFAQPDAAMMMSFSGKVDATNKVQLDQAIESMRKQITQELDKDDSIKSEEAKTEIKKGANDLVDAIAATLAAGKIDGGAVLNTSAEAATFVAGGFIAEPAKVESAFKTIFEAAKKEAKEKGETLPEVKWDASTHGDVKFHTVAVPHDGSDKAKKFFGDAVEVALGIGKTSVYLGVGRDSVKAVEKVIDDSAASPDKPAPPMEMSIALAPIMNAAKAVADASDMPTIDMISNMLANEANGRDHFRMSVQAIENGMRMRMEAEEGVLRSIGMGYMAAQMKAMGAHP